MTVIHVQWDGPFSLEQVSELNNEDHDYGVYQVYGSHPIYGSDVLLYIGKASQQTFATRLRQEPWLYNQDARAAGKILIDSERRKNTQASNDVRARQLARF